MPDIKPAADLHARTGRALSIKQPWSWLIVHGHKAVENRDWPTNVRGWIGIHAGQKLDEDGYEWVRRQFPHIAMPDADAFERGGIVGRARVVSCVSTLDSPWFFGEFGFVLADAEPLPFVPCRGMLGFFSPVIAEARS